MRWRALGLLVAVAAVASTAAAGQDSVRVGISYRPGVRPGIVVLPSPGLDSVQAIVARDLDYSDRFEVISLTEAVPAGRPNYALYRTLGAGLVLELAPTGSGQVTARLHDVAAERVRSELTVTLDRSGVGEGRLSVHRLSDELVRLATGQPGVAATRILFLNDADKRVWRVDTDGGNVAPVSPPGVATASPAWAPDGSRIAYMQFSADGSKPIVLQALATGTRTIVPETGRSQNITPAFSPDGRGLVFARMSDQGVSLYTANVRELCCVERLTGGRFAENLSPTYSPDGRRVAFVSTRAGGQQIYVMAADGTEQELLVPFDFGDTGNSNAPDWSPDGAAIAFHREVGGSPQIYTFDLAARRLKSWTSLGRNEDPSWGPDGRHVVFVSNRSGRRQLFVVDTETARVRQIMTPMSTRLPAWSKPLGRLQ